MTNKADVKFGEIGYKECRTCLTSLPTSKFPKSGKSYRPHCHNCVYKKSARYREGQTAKTREYQRRYHLANAEAARYKSLAHADKVKGRTGTISLEDYRLLIENECHYCGTLDDLSVDRIDNNEGHCLHNLVACCEKCNNILGDLPYQAKLILKPGLRALHLKGVLIEWIIPTKRNIKKVI